MDHQDQATTKDVEDWSDIITSRNPKKNYELGEEFEKERDIESRGISDKIFEEKDEKVGVAINELLRLATLHFFRTSLIFDVACLRFIDRKSSNSTSIPNAIPQESPGTLG